MKKKVGIIKRVTCLVLIFLLNINSFAAIVSDNDGSAFITKSEFDALKSSFQSQIDSYNNSIDSKIDGAIASYLSGIQLATKQSITMPTAQRLYKTLDSTNYPETWDNISLQMINAFLYYFPGDMANIWRPPITWYFNYKQNDGTKVSDSFVATATGSSSYNYILRGYTHNFAKKVVLTNISEGRQTPWNDTVWQRFSAIGFFAYGDSWTTFYSQKDTGGYLGTKKNKVYLGNNIIAPNTDMGYNIGYSHYDSDTQSEKRVVSSEISYDLEPDCLVMPLGNYGTLYPVQVDAQYKQNPQNRVDAEYVEWGTKGQTITGWGSQGKSLGNTVNYTDGKSWTSITDMQADVPWAFQYADALQTTKVNDVSGRFMMNAHAYYTSSDDFTVYDGTSMTNEYANSGLIPKIKTDYASYIRTIDGVDYYKYDGGLILCEIPKKGKLTFKVTAKTDNVYLYLYDKPSSRSTSGINVPGDSNTSRGNGIALTKNVEKTITFDVDPNIYYFRFGKYVSDWTKLEGGAQIQFANEFELEFEN